MSVLIFIDQAEGAVKQASLEAISYGVRIAEMLGTTAEGIIFGTEREDLAGLGEYGLKKVHAVGIESLDGLVFTEVIAQTAKASGAEVIVFANNLNGKSLAPGLSVKLQAGLVSGAVTLPEIKDGFTVTKNVFSGKALATIAIKTPVKIIALNPNSFKAVKTGGIAEVVMANSPALTPKVKITAVDKVAGEVSLSEARLVISGGRGLKAPENWYLVTDLAKLLGAATACSRAVADADWRPHHEHVGQTGLAITPDLYFAIGISGAIQHLAGVNRSKVIVVINKDPEAPFFKAADYGIVGDAFEVMPKIVDAVKKLKGL